MEKSTYWAIYEGKTIRFEGTFSECWKQFVQRFAEQTVASLTAQGIRIARQS